jgi:hypothetical protein
MGEADGTHGAGRRGGAERGVYAAGAWKRHINEMVDLRPISAAVWPVVVDAALEARALHTSSPEFPRHDQDCCLKVLVQDSPEAALVLPTLLSRLRAAGIEYDVTRELGGVQGILIRLHTRANRAMLRHVRGSEPLPSIRGTSDRSHYAAVSHMKRRRMPGQRRPLLDPWPVD